MANLRLLCTFVFTFLAYYVPGARAQEGPESFPLKWIRIHGWLMWLGMGLFMPVAIVLVRFAKQARERGDLKTVRILVYTHISIQVTAVLAVICSAVVAITKFDNNFHYTHERLGLTLWILVWIAPLLGFVRPDHGVRARPVWYAAHWLAGTGGVILGFYNIFTGLHAYEFMRGKSMRTLNILFSIQLSLVAFVYLTQDRWQHLKNQGKLNKMVTPMYNGQKPNNGATTVHTSDGPHEAHIQINPNA